MKKTYYLRLLALFAFIIAFAINSCIKDERVELKTLELSASALQVYTGESVDFVVKVDDKVVPAIIYINDNRITGLSYIFDTAGTFYAQARLDGHVESVILTITVTDKPKLTLTADKTEIFKGETVTFTVTSGGKTVPADIYVGSTKISGRTYTFNNTGTFSVQARLDGHVESVILTITVKDLVYRTDVYVAGYEIEGAYSVAKYWKNGTPVSLTNGANDAYANSIFIYNGDVYVAGVEEVNHETTVAKYWKNGVATSLTNGSTNAEATFIFVYNGDVYVAGFEREGLNNVAKYWKNGAPVSLGGRNTNSNAFLIYLDNGVVYVAGRENEGDTEVAKYWRNGAPYKLSNGNNDATAYSIFVNNNNVYVAGREFNGSVDVAKYWSNGSSNTLSSGANEATAYSVFYSNGSVYVAGTDGDVAKYWRNGAANTLSGGTGANSIFVHEGDIYVAGYEYNGEVFVAKYWKNGQPTSLTNGINFAYGYSVFIYKYLVE